MLQGIVFGILAYIVVSIVRSRISRRKSSSFSNAILNLDKSYKDMSVTLKNDERLCLAECSALVYLIHTHGASNLIFMLPMRRLHNLMNVISYTSSSDTPEMIPCVIQDAEHLSYSWQHDYKIRFKAIYEGYGTEELYVETINSLIAANKIIVYKDINAKVVLENNTSRLIPKVVSQIAMPSRDDIRQVIKRADQKDENITDAVFTYLRSCIVSTDWFKQQLQTRCSEAWYGAKHTETTKWHLSESKKNLDAYCSNEICPDGIVYALDVVGMNDMLDKLNKISDAASKIQATTDSVTIARLSGEISELSNPYKGIQ